MAFITGTTGNDFLEGTQDNDVIRGLAGDDSLRGLDNADDINGNVGNDLINGNQGNDTLHGGSGNDTIYGGQDNDIIWGDRGTDLLIGGFGNDLFVLDNRDTASSVLAEADCIADFSNGDRQNSSGGGLGRDILGLTGGITFDDIDIFDGTGDLEGDTIIQDRVTGKYLGIIKGIDRSQFTGEDFTTSIIPIFPSGSVVINGGGTPGVISTPGVLAPSPSPIPTFTPSPDVGGEDGGGGGNNSLPNPCIPTPAEIPTPVAPPVSPTFTVTTTQQLIDAVATAVSGNSIFVAPGIYDGPVPLAINTPNLTFFTNNTSVSGVTGVRSAETVLRFGFNLNGNATGTRILGFTFDDGVAGGGNFGQAGFGFPIVIDQVGVNTDNLVIQNNRFLNVENRAIYLNSANGNSADNLIITGNFIDGTNRLNESGILIFNASNVDIFNNAITDYERGITLDAITASTNVKLNHISNASLLGIQSAGVMQNLQIEANQFTTTNTSGSPEAAIVFFQSYDDTNTNNEVCGNTINGNGVNGISIQAGAIVGNTMINSNNFQQVGVGATGIVNDSLNIVSPNNFFGPGIIQTGGAFLTNTTPVSPLPYVIAPSF